MALRRWFRVEHALHWAGTLAALFILVSVASQSLKYESLARRGQLTTATVLAYEPRRPSYRGGGYTYHDHLLSFAGQVERVELSHMQPPGSHIQVVYLPERPASAVEVAPDTKPGDLMGLATLGRLLTFGVGGLLLLLWGIRGLFMGFMGPTASGSGPRDKLRVTH